MRTSSIIRLFVFCLVFSGTAVAGTLDDAFLVVNSTSWGTPRQLVRNGMEQEPLFENEEIIIAEGNTAGHPATINYLFNKSGALYNLAWYAAIPVSEMTTAGTIESELEQALQARYGAPIKNFSDGDVNQAATVAADATDHEAARERLLEEIKAKKAQGLEKEAMQLTAQLFMTMPMIFYSKLAMWDGGGVWAYTCSTDGACYMHLQFVSKSLTAGENYAATPEKLFSYSPADRDQDMVTKYNRIREAQE